MVFGLFKKSEVPEPGVERSADTTEREVSETEGLPLELQGWSPVTAEDGRTGVKIRSDAIWGVAVPRADDPESFTSAAFERYENALNDAGSRHPFAAKWNEKNDHLRGAYENINNVTKDLRKVIRSGSAAPADWEKFRKAVEDLNDAEYRAHLQEIGAAAPVAPVEAAPAAPQETAPAAPEPAPASNARAAQDQGGPVTSATSAAQGG